MPLAELGTGIVLQVERRFHIDIACQAGLAAGGWAVRAGIGLLWAEQNTGTVVQIEPPIRTGTGLGAVVPVRAELNTGTVVQVEPPICIGTGLEAVVPVRIGTGLEVVVPVGIGTGLEVVDIAAQHWLEVHIGTALLLAAVVVALLPTHRFEEGGTAAGLDTVG